MLRQAVLLTFFVLLIGCANPANTVEVHDAWARPSTSSTTTSAFYLVIDNNSPTDEALLSAESEACGSVEIHESYLSQGDVMSMRPATPEQLRIAPGGALTFAVGGLHIMCLDKRGAFAEGTTVPLTLNLRQTGKIDVAVEIRQ